MGLGEGYVLQGREERGRKREVTEERERERERETALIEKRKAF